MEEQSKKNKISEEQEINIVDLVKTIWNQRRFVLKICLVAFVVAIVVALSIPKQYVTTVVLASERSAAKSASMGQLAAMAGINMPSQGMQELSPDIYPDVMSSTPFLLGLFDVPVHDSKRNINTTLSVYLSDYQRKAWWSYIVSAPSKLLSVFSSKDVIHKEDGHAENSGVLTISAQQAAILGALKGCINIASDKKTGLLTLTATMQSPEISALVADTVTFYMQDYIVRYRTQKARQDLLFTEKLYAEAQSNYYKSQQTYAAYTDENMGIISARYRTTQERLQNEMNLMYSVYNQMAQQLQLAKVKVQDTTPVYTIVQPAVVPLGPSSPKKMYIVLGLLSLAFIGSCGWILIKDVWFKTS